MLLYTLLRWVAAALRKINQPEYATWFAQAAFAVLADNLHKDEEACEDAVYALDDQLYYMEQANDKLLLRAREELQLS